ncbi:UTP--glucose-1-phosphate uridylyltransferase GalU [Candidatus Moduliflexota bacterium]
MSIKKAVFPVGGLGTRFLPATKAMPKEMLTLVDKPLIQYCVEEAKQAGITEVIFVTGRGKRAIEDHFDVSYELENTLTLKGKKKLRDELRKIHELANFAYVRQGEPLGLGHAVLAAKNLVGNEPFAVILGDDVIRAKVPCLKQMIKVFEKQGGPVVAVEKVSGPAIKDYGVIKNRKIDDQVHQIVDLVEKPEPSQAPSDLAVIGRYILTPAIFRYLETTKAGRGGEIQLTDALKRMAQDYPIFGYQFDGKRYDAGNKLGFLKATVEYAMDDPDLGETFKKYMRGLKP